MAIGSRKSNLTDSRALAEPAEVAAHLKVDEATLANWRWRKIGPPWLKLERGRVRYRWADVEKWLDTQARGPEAA